MSNRSAPAEKDWNLLFWEFGLPLTILGSVLTLFLRFIANAR